MRGVITTFLIVVLPRPAKGIWSNVLLLLVHLPSVVNSESPSLIDGRTCKAVNYYELTKKKIQLTSTVALRFVNDDMLLFWRRSNSEPCEPFTTFSVQCNTCVCSADTTLYCTKMYCGKKDEE